MPYQALLVADIDRTQDYVFETSRLPEIRGASDLLKKQEQEVVRRVEGAGGNVIIQGGGSLLALMPAVEGLDALCQDIEKQFTEKTLTATLTAAWRPIDADMLKNGWPPHPETAFGRLWEWAGTWLRSSKDCRDLLPWLETPPFAERCSSCHLRPASREHSFPDRLLCHVCAHKVEADPRQVRNRASGDEVFAPHDLSEIGQASRGRRGYIGLIYLDGDGMGGRMRGLISPESAAELSRALRELIPAVIQANRKEIEAVGVRPSPGRPPHERSRESIRIDPVEILVSGGDDVVLIVPGHLAIPLACQISAGFQQAMQSRFPGSEPFTLSGGVVIADDHNPVRALRDLALELKTNAKRARYKDKAKEGYLDFLALLGTDTLDRDLEASRKMYPYRIGQMGLQSASPPERPAPGSRPLSLLARPYPASRLLAAWEELQALRAAHFPNSQMSLLARQLHKGVQESSLYYQYQRQRSGGFVHLERALRLLQGETALEPWVLVEQPAGIAARTALWDLAELYSLAD